MSYLDEFSYVHYLLSFTLSVSQNFLNHTTSYDISVTNNMFRDIWGYSFLLIIMKVVLV